MLAVTKPLSVSECPTEPRSRARQPRRADPLAETWARLSHGVVEPGSAIPEPVLRVAPYPGELFRIQAQELEHTPWNAGSLGGGTGQAAAEPPPPQVGWAADTSGPQLVSTFESPFAVLVSSSTRKTPAWVKTVAVREKVVWAWRQPPRLRETSIKTTADNRVLIN